MAVCAAVVIAGCGSDGGKATTVSSKSTSVGSVTTVKPSSPVATTNPASVTTVATPTTGGATATTATPATAAPTVTTIPTPATTPAGPHGSLDAPLPVGTPFHSVDPYGGVAAWEGTVLGMVETPLSSYNEEKGRCLLAMGTISPTAIDAGIISSGYMAPTVSLLADGKVVDSETGQCDTSTADAAGYRWLLDASVTVGTTYPFYVEFFLGGATPATPQVIVLGDAHGSDALFYAPTLLPSVPSPGKVVTVSAATGHELQPMGDPSTSTFTYKDPYSENVWTGTMLGLVEATQYEGATEVGRCLVLVAKMTPTKVATGAIADPYTEPNFSLIASGRQVLSYGGSCDTSAFDDAGYGDRYTEVTQGTSFAFHESFFLPGATPETPEAVVVGDPVSDTYFLFEPKVLPAIPAV
jgi:hypothetical protein